MTGADTRSQGLLLGASNATMHWGEGLYIGLYRLLGGRWVDRWTGGMPVLLLTTTGRRSGLARTVALGHLQTGRGLLVAGTNGGREPVPGWVWNLRADPTCHVEAGRERYNAAAEFVEDDEYETHWRRLVAEYPIYQTARDILTRPVPLILLRPEDK